MNQGTDFSDFVFGGQDHIRIDVDPSLQANKKQRT